MRLKGTWIMLAVALVAAAYFFLVEQPRHAKKVEREEAQSKLTQLSSDDINEITIQRPDGTLAFHREKSDWHMDRPAADNADQASVNTLLRTTTDAAIDRRMKEVTTDLSAYGLDPPAATVTLTPSGDKKPLKVAIGDLTITKSNCYARIDSSSEVLLLPAGLRRYALRDVFEFRDKVILPFAIQDALGVKLQSKARTLDWKKRPPGAWFTVEHGDTILGDKTEVEGLISQLRGLRATRIPMEDEQTAAGHFRSSRGSVSLWLEPDSTMYKFVFGETSNDGCYVKVEPRTRVAVVDSSVLVVFRKSLDDLRDRHLLAFERDSLGKIEFDMPQESLSIVKTADTWTFSNPTHGEIDQGEVASFLNKLGTVKYRNILEERVKKATAHGFDAPAYRVALYDSNGRLMDQLTIGSEREHPVQTRFATSLSSGHLGIVDDEPLADLATRFKKLASQ